MWEGPGFVDHHTHMIRVAGGVRPRYDYSSPESIAAFHRSVWFRGLTPMDVEAEPVTVPDLEDALRSALAEAAMLGLVAVTEAGMADWSHLDALLRLRDREEMPLKVRVLVASGLADETGPTLRRTGDDLVEVIGVKFYADGWLGPRTCALCQPFDDRKDDAGILFLDSDALARRAVRFADAGWTIATHAIGDRAVENVLGAYERIYGDDCSAAAPRIEHAQVVHPDVVARMADLGVVACIQPSFAASDAEIATAALGDRVAHAYMWRSMLDAGVRIIGGSDYPIEDMSPLVGLQRLVVGAAVGEALDVDAALGIMTDATCGTVTLDADPRDVDPEELAAIQVLQTALS